MSIKEVKSIADISLPEEGTVDLPRGKSALRIPIKALSFRESQEIMNAHKDPAPPRKMRKEGGKATGEWYFDEGDPVYLEQLSERQTERTIAMALASIVIPDLTAESLAELFTMGDISIILDAVNALSNVTLDDEVKKSSASG